MHTRILYSRSGDCVLQYATCASAGRALTLCLAGEPRIGSHSSPRSNPSIIDSWQRWQQEYTVHSTVHCTVLNQADAPQCRTAAPPAARETFWRHSNQLHRQRMSIAWHVRHMTIPGLLASSSDRHRLVRLIRHYEYADQTDDIPSLLLCPRTRSYCTGITRT